MVSAPCARNPGLGILVSKKYPSQCWPSSDNQQKGMCKGHSLNNPRRGHV